MINILIGTVSAFLVLFSFALIEKKRVNKIGNTKYLMILMIIFSAFLINPYENHFDWIIWLLFFYTVLDDIKTKTVFVPIYIIIIIILILAGEPLQMLLFAALLLIFFLIFSKKTKETFFRIGDICAIFPLAYWLGTDVLFAILLALLMASAFLPLIYGFIRGSYYPFTPYLVMAAILVKYDWNQNIILTVSIAINLVLRMVFSFSKKTRK